MAVIAVFVCLVGVIGMPFRYPITTLKVLAFSLYVGALMAAGGETASAGIFAPFVLFVGWYFSKGDR